MSPLAGEAVEPFQTTGETCELAGGADCCMLWIEDSPNCRASKSCTPTSDWLKRAETHFAQLYRLLSTYEIRSDKTIDEIYVPFGAFHDHLHVVGDGSPRCYGGLVEP